MLAGLDDTYYIDAVGVSGRMPPLNENIIDWNEK
jgi:hypothetical protein